MTFLTSTMISIGLGGLGTLYGKNVSPDFSHNCTNETFAEQDDKEFTFIHVPRKNVNCINVLIMMFLDLKIIEDCLIVQGHKVFSNKKGQVIKVVPLDPQAFALICSIVAHGQIHIRYANKTYKTYENGILMVMKAYCVAHILHLEIVLD